MTLARWSRVSPVLVALVTAVLGACAPDGDFGRPHANTLNDRILPAAGTYLARQREEPASAYPYTDAEKEMRQLGYALIMPAHPLDRWNHFFAEMRRTRIVPPPHGRPDPQGYCETLLAERYRSSTSRFHRLSDDIRGDRSRIAPFFARAADVAEADRVRSQAMTYVSDLTPERARHANDRIAENRMVVDWVRDGLSDRVMSYRCALHRLIVATPEAVAVEAERELRAFEAEVLALSRSRRAPPTAITIEPRDGRYFPRTPPVDEVISK